MLFSVAFGVPEKSVFTRLFDLFASATLANFQDRLVMTASISLQNNGTLYFTTIQANCQASYNKIPFYYGQPVEFVL